jgi:hypothetical protein
VTVVETPAGASTLTVTVSVMLASGMTTLTSTVVPTLTATSSRRAV